LSLFCDTRRTRQRIRETRRRNFGHMPRLKHYVPGSSVRLSEIRAGAVAHEQRKRV